MTEEQLERGNQISGEIFTLKKKIREHKKALIFISKTTLYDDCIYLDDGSSEFIEIKTRENTFYVQEDSFIEYLNNILDKMNKLAEQKQKEFNEI